MTVHATQTRCPARATSEGLLCVSAVQCGLPSLEQAHRSTRDDHVHRIERLGAHRSIINAVGIRQRFEPEETGLGTGRTHHLVLIKRTIQKFVDRMLTVLAGCTGLMHSICSRAR